MNYFQDMKPRARMAWGVAGAFAAALLFYTVLHLRYQVYFIDDGWTTHYIYNSYKLGIDADTLFRQQDSILKYLVFGKTYYNVYGVLLDLFGWTKGVTHAISTAFLFLCVPLWYGIARRLGFGETFSRITAFAMLFFPAFFSSANTARQDTMVLFLILASFLFFLRGRYVLSGLTGMIGLETHLMGLVFGFYIIAFVIHERRTIFSDRAKALKMAGLFATGIILGLAYYFMLHWGFYEAHSLDMLRDILLQRQEMKKMISNYIFAYFFPGNFWVNLPELVLVLVTFAIFIIRRLWRTYHFTAILFVVLVLSTIITRRPNGQYMLFIYPAFLLMIFAVFENLKLLKPLCVATAVLLASHYAMQSADGFGYDFESVRRRTAAALQDPTLPVVGMADNWFAAMDRDFYPIYHGSVRTVTNQTWERCYLVRNDYIKRHSRNYDVTIGWFMENYRMEPLDEFDAGGGKTVAVYLCERKTADRQPR